MMLILLFVLLLVVLIYVLLLLLLSVPGLANCCDGAATNRNGVLPFPLKEPLADKKSAGGAFDFGFVPVMKWALSVAAPTAVIFGACAVSVPLVWLGARGNACE